MNINGILLTSLLIPILFACRQNDRSDGLRIPPKSKAVDTTDAEDYIAVLPAEEIPHKEILSASEMSIINSLLHEAVDKFNIESQTSRSNRIIDLRKYKRQYIVSYDKVKGKMVHVNCLCEVSGDDWKKAEILVRDGGHCYFNLMINLKLRKYFRFMVNGLA